MEKKVLLVFVCLFQRNIFLVLLIEIKLEEELKKFKQYKNKGEWKLFNYIQEFEYHAYKR